MGVTLNIHVAKPIECFNSNIWVSSLTAFNHLCHVFSGSDIWQLQHRAVPSNKVRLKFYVLKTPPVTFLYVFLKYPDLLTVFCSQ